MISDKMKVSLNGSSVIRAMFEEGKKTAAIYGAENVYDFSLGNPYAEPPEIVKKTLINVLETQPQNLVHGYTNNSGYEDIREYIASATNEEFGTNYNMDNIVMTNGAAAALNIIFKTLLNPGDEVIVFSPFFGEYRSYVSNYDGNIIIVPTDTNTFQIDMDKFKSAVTKKTKAVIINSPNNPTGVIYNENTIKELSDILNKKQSELGTSIYLVSDEPYRKLIFDETTVPFVPNYYSNTFFAYSFSKSLSLPGERIGYIIINEGMDDFNDVIGGLNVATRISGFVNAPSLFQRILPECMSSEIDMNIYKENRSLLYNKLIELGFECIKPNGAFYMFPKTLIPNDTEFCTAAKEFRIFTTPGSSFGCSGHFRLAYCVSKDTILNSFDSFEKLANKYLRWKNMEKLWRNNLIKIDPYVPGEQPNGNNIIKLNANENPYPPSPNVIQAIKDFDGSCLKCYPSSDCTELKTVLAQYYGVETNQIFVGNGSDDVIALSFMAFFNSEKPILFPDITYSFYTVWCSLFKTRYTTIPLTEDFRINYLDYNIENGGIILPNPNAPTGISENKEFLEHILINNPNSIVIIDEAYSGFGGYSCVELLDKFDNLLVVQTFSKSRSLAGIRIGVAIGGKELVQTLETVKNSYNSYTMDSIALKVGIESIKDDKYYKEILEKIILTRERVSNEFENMGFKVFPSSSNFIFVTHAEKDAKTIFEELKKQNIFIRYFNLPRIDNYLRITIGTDEDMNKLLEATKNILK